MAKKGAPTLYSTELIDRLCEVISQSEFGLHTICRNNPDFPSVTTIIRWLTEEDKKDFRAKYTRARELQAEFMGDKMLEIADDGTNDYMTITKGDQSYNVEDKEVTNRSKLRVETRKWLMSKLAPKKYGDKLELDGKVETTPGVTPEMVGLIAQKINQNAKA